MDDIPEIEIEGRASLDDLPSLPKASNVFGGRRRSSIGARRLSKFTTRRESMGSEKLINDFISAAGIASNRENFSAITHKKLDQFAPNFVPQHVREFCQKSILKNPHAPDQNTLTVTNEKSQDQLEPYVLSTFAAVVMVDVSGYSKLSAALAEKGPIGSELLSKSMKGYLDKVQLIF